MQEIQPHEIKVFYIMSRNVHKNFYHYFTASKKRGSMCKAQNNKMKYVFYIKDIVVRVN